MLTDNNPTPLDVRFRLLGFPVRVTPWFWLTMALLGGSTLDNREVGPLALVIWVACGFLSILVHELGHAVSGRWFRADSHIVLTAFGGYAQYDRGVPHGWRGLTVSLMGPVAGFLLLGFVIVSDLSTEWTARHPVLELVGQYLFVQCLFWNLFNLLPVWPLDGGQALREILYICGKRRPEPATHMVSMFVAGVLVLIAVMAMVNPAHPVVQWVPFVRGPMMVVWFGLFGILNWQQLQLHTASHQRWDTPDDDAPWRGR